MIWWFSLPKTLTLSTWWSIPLQSAHITAPLALRKKGDQALGRSRGGFTSKIHILSDGLGNPLKFIISAGQRADISQAERLVGNQSGHYLLADKGYDSTPFILFLIERRLKPVIPPRGNRKKKRLYDEWIYRERHAIECFIGKLKHFRRVSSRYDKLASRFLSFVQLAATMIWLRWNVHTT